MSEFTGGKRTCDIDFGDYVEIEMHRYGAPNEFYLHKVIGAFKASSWATVPIQQGIVGTGTQNVPRDELEEVLNVVQCGIDETKVFRVRKRREIDEVMSNIIDILVSLVCIVIVAFLIANYVGWGILKLLEKLKERWGNDEN